MQALIAKILEKALERGVITEKEAETLEDNEIYELIFARGSLLLIKFLIFPAAVSDLML